MKKVIYHGSDKVIKTPYFGGSKPNNDFGVGFYCTEDYELAKEWAGYQDKIGYVNCYKLNTNELKILDLTNSQYSVLNWIAILFKHRGCNLRTETQKNMCKLLLDKYYIDVTKYDLVIGWRADDSYFMFARDFLSNLTTINVLSQAMKLAELGKQIVLISKKSYKYIKWIKSEKVDVLSYWVKKQLRNIDATNKYKKIIKNPVNKNDQILLEILKGK